LCLAAAVWPTADAAQHTGWDALFLYDRPVGWWFPNWGRNFLLATEGMYHVLAALAWLGALQRRWGRALGALAVLAASHPFTGAQHLAIFGVWTGLLAWRERTAAAWGRCGAVAVLAAAFAGYYFGFLPRFEGHRALQAAWGHQWTMPWSTILLAAGPVGLVAAWRCWRERAQLGEREGFLLVALGVTWLLLKHDLFMAPHQPAHFSRGYNWLPLWLLAVPYLHAGRERWRAGRPRREAAVAVGLAAAVLVSDNAAFLGRELAYGEDDRQQLEPAQRDVLRWMDRAGLDGVLLTREPRLGYLAATYSGVRPYLGHVVNTPEPYRRWQEIKAWHTAGETGPWYRDIDYVLAERRNPPAAFAWAEWRELYRNDEYVLLGRGAAR
jgi:hypothetical protein